MAIRGSDYDALTFDVYGTILDWEPDVADFLHAWAVGNSLEISKAKLLDLYDCVRQPLQSQKPALRYPQILERTFDAVVRSFGHEPDQREREAFGRLAAKHRPFPDSIPALNTLRSNGFLLCALSNIDDASFRRVMTAAGFSFDIVVTAERVGAYKPDQAHFWAVLSDLLARDIPPDRVLHVAQSRRADIVPANAIGLRSVWVNRPGRIFGQRGQGAETASPDAETDSLDGVISLLT